jgi:hypothetical protein
MDLAATNQDVPVGPRIYMQVSCYCRKGTTSLCADTCLLLLKYSVKAAGMTDVIVDTHLRLGLNAQPLL